MDKTEYHQRDEMGLEQGRKKMTLSTAVPPVCPSGSQVWSRACALKTTFKV